VKSECFPYRVDYIVRLQQGLDLVFVDQDQLGIIAHGGTP
jgi:hypothetical protein